MNIHEYQAKELLAKFGVAVPRGAVAYTAAEAVAAARRLGGPVWVVKAQIHAGGRGKAGGVKLVRSEDEVAAAAREHMLGMNLVTHQTGPAGPRGQARLCRGRLRHRPRTVSRPADRPRRPARVTLDRLDRGRRRDRGGGRNTRRRRSSRWRSTRRAGSSRSMPARSPMAWASKARQVGVAVKFITALYRAFTELDASIVEINPLVVTGAGELRGARRQDRLRRQRALPPPRDRRAARRGRGGPERGRGRQARAQLHQARRQYRLHGQRRRPRHGDDGHHQALWRQPGQFPRCRRRGDARAGRRPRSS